MNITMLHEIDTGFMAATLKPAFEALGHTCTVIQGFKTHIENNTDHVDYFLSEMTKEQTTSMNKGYKDTDLFIVRAGDGTMKYSGALPHLSNKNTVFRLHGADILTMKRPYALKTWRINWHNKEPIVTTYSDPSFLKHLKSNVVYIERPINLDIIPRKKKSELPFALTSPTHMLRKGADELKNIWKKGNIPLKIISNTHRQEVLQLKAQSSYLINNINEEYKGGPYGMNSVEAWLMKIPVFSLYHPIHTVVCPELPKLVTNVSLHTAQDIIQNYEYNKKNINYAYKYALRTHDPLIIAQQYLSLLSYIQ